MKLKLYNSQSKTKEEFKPIGKTVGLYTCGPTVYDYAHIGNLRMYIHEDILKKTLELNDYKVNHVMNITDVGHLVSDSDTGEDKLEVGAEREKLTIQEIAQKYTDAFQNDLKKLNISEPKTLCKATDHIKEQIKLIQKLEEKGFTYQTSDGVYFDSTKFEKYGELAKLDIAGLKFGARVKKLTGKKNVTDFALWKFSPTDKKRLMEWESPWGVGFPGWHIECSAMAMKYLGDTIDIHCGGIDHLTVHHTNEVAQSEAATGKTFVNYWMHGEHLLFDGKKMSKSDGNFATLTDLIDRGFNPLAYRYLVLTTHYRSKLNFTWKSMESAQSYLDSFYNRLKPLGKPGEPLNKYSARFLDALNDDLDTPKALSIMQELLKSKEGRSEILATVLKFDEVLGLGVSELLKIKLDIPAEISKLAEKRDEARLDGNWPLADTLRQEIVGKGYNIEDTSDGHRISKI